MALINCPQCGKTVSDKATTCPHCGSLISPSTSKKTNGVSDSAKRIIWVILIVGGVLLTWYGAYELSTRYYVNDEAMWGLASGIVLMLISSFMYISLIHKWRCLHIGVITAIMLAILIPAGIKHQELVEFEKKFCHLTSPSQLQNIYLKSRTSETYIYFQGNTIVVKIGEESLYPIPIRVDGSSVYREGEKSILFLFSPWNGIAEAGYYSVLLPYGDKWDVLQLTDKSSLSSGITLPAPPAPLEMEAVGIVDSVAIVEETDYTSQDSVVACDTTYIY